MEFLTEEQAKRAKDSGAEWVVEKAQEFIGNLVNESDKQTKIVTELKEENERLTKGAHSPDAISDLTKQLERTAKEKAELSERLRKVERESGILSERLTSSERLCNFRGEEIEKLKADIEELTAKNRDLSEFSRKLEDEKNQIASTNVSGEIQLLERRIQVQDKETTWLKESLDDRMQELLELRKTSSSQILDLESKLDESGSKVKHLEDQLHAAKVSAESQERSLKHDLESQKKMIQLRETNEASLEKQIATQENLINVYKNDREEVAKELNDLREEIDALNIAKQEMLKRHKAEMQKKDQVFDEKISELEQQRLDDQKQMEATLKDKRDAEDRERETFRNRKDFSQSAAEAELQSRGYSSTALYQQLSEERDAHLVARNEIKQLKGHLKRILHDIEQKAPEIKQLRDQYDRALEAYDCAQNSLIQSNNDRERAQEALKWCQEECAKYKKEAEQQSAQRHDLSKQLQYLLRQQHQKGVETSGMVASPMRKQNPSTSLVPVEGNDVISEHLLVWKNTDDLQRINETLLSTVRALTNKVDEMEDEMKKENEERKKEEMESVLKELEEMRETRERQEKMILAIVNQRNMYRVLLAQADAAHMKSGTANAENVMLLGNSSTSTPSATSPRSPVSAPAKQTPSGEVEKSSHLVSGQGGVDYPTLLKESRIEFAEFREASRRAALELQKQIDDQKETVTKSRVEVAQARLDCNFQKQRYEELVSRLELARQEATRAHEEKAKSYAELASQQKLLAEQGAEHAMVTAKLGTLTKEKSLAEGTIKSLKDQIEYLKERCTDIEKQRDAQRQLVDSLTQLKDSRVSDLKISIEQFKSSHDKLAEQVNELKKELAESRHRLMQEELKSTAQIKTAIREKEEAIADAKVSKDTLTKLESELDTAKEREKMLRENLDAARRVATQSRAVRLSIGESAATGTVVGASSSTEETGTAAPDSAQASEIIALRMQLQAKAKDADAYRVISKSNEDAIEKLSKASEAWKKEKQQELEKLTKERDELREKLAQASKVAADERASIVEKANKFEKRVLSSEQKAAKALAELATAQSVAKDALRDVEIHSKEADSANANYNRELQLHASASIELQALKKKASAIETERNDLRAQLGEAEGKMKITQETYDKERVQLEDRLDYMKKQLSDTSRQNELLSEQTSVLSKEVKSMQQQILHNGAPEGEEGTSTDNSDRNVQIARLRELLQITQRQRDVGNVEKEELELQVSRLKQKLQCTQSELQQTKDDLLAKIEQVTKGSAVVPLDEHKRLLSGIQENVVLRNMNTMLTAEHETVREQLTKAENEVQMLRSKLKPSETANRKEEGIRVALEADKAALEKESEMYRERYDKLLKRFGDKIDPAEHKDVVEKVESLTKRVEELTEEISKLKKQLETERARNKDLQNFGRKIRQQLFDKTAELEAAEKVKSELEAKVSESTSESTESQELVQQVEGLKKNLASKELVVTRFRKKIKEQNQKIAMLTNASNTLAVTPTPVAPVSVSENQAPAAAVATSAEEVTGTKRKLDASAAPFNPVGSAPKKGKPGDSSTNQTLTAAALSKANAKAAMAAKLAAAKRNVAAKKALAAAKAATAVKPPAAAKAATAVKPPAAAKAATAVKPPAAVTKAPVAPAKAPVSPAKVTPVVAEKPSKKALQEKYELLKANLAAKKQRKNSGAGLSTVDNSGETEAQKVEDVSEKEKAAARAQRFAAGTKPAAQPGSVVVLSPKESLTALTDEERAAQRAKRFGAPAAAPAAEVKAVESKETTKIVEDTPKETQEEPLATTASSSGFAQSAFGGSTGTGSSSSGFGGGFAAPSSSSGFGTSSGGFAASSFGSSSFGSASGFGSSSGGGGFGSKPATGGFGGFGSGSGGFQAASTSQGFGIGASKASPPSSGEKDDNEQTAGEEDVADEEDDGADTE